MDRQEQMRKSIEKIKQDLNAPKHNPTLPGPSYKKMEDFMPQKLDRMIAGQLWTKLLQTPQTGEDADQPAVPMGPPGPYDSLQVRGMDKFIEAILAEQTGPQPAPPPAPAAPAKEPTPQEPAYEMSAPAKSSLERLKRRAQEEEFEQAVAKEKQALDGIFKKYDKPVKNLNDLKKRARDAK
jgi:hypothetical protein